MAITQDICSTFKQQLFQAQHNFDAGTGDTFYLALYEDTATIAANTTVYTTSGEVSSSGTNYPTGGGALTSLGVSLATATAFLGFTNLTFPSVTLTARGCLIYNSTNANKAVAVFDFGSNKTSTSGDFTVIFPAATALAAVIRLV